MLEKGSKGTDHLGRVFVDYGNKRVGLNNTWDNKDLENHWVISSYELRNTTEKPTHFPTSQAITKEKDIHSLNSVGPNPTTNPLKTQDLSPLELANAEKLAKQESERLESGNKIFDFYSDRNFTDFRDSRPQPSTSKDSRPLPTTLDEPNLTQKSLTSQENLLKIRENLFITDTLERYVRNHVRNADIIHSFIQPNRTAKSDDALNAVVVYGENTTKNP